MASNPTQPQTAPEKTALPRPSGSMRKIASGDFGYDQARHLLWRAGFGGTSAQIRALATMGIDDAVALLVDPARAAAPEPVAPDRFDAGIIQSLSPEDLLRYRRAQQDRDEDVLAQFRLRRQQQQRTDRRQIADVQRWWLQRMIESPRPLEEKMTLFWHGHFATGYRKVENSYHLFQQNQMFRRNAVGNFGALLAGIVRDPAMLGYLDNQLNRRAAPNENLAREIMELFALGEGNYSESDIREGARALTGYSFDGNDFVFRRALHDTGSKRILGRSGNFDGEDFVEIILSQRACAEFISKKLYEFFVGQVPTDRRDPAQEPIVSAIRQMARTMVQHKYELTPVLTELFQSEHFYSPRFVCEQIKSPVQLVVGAVRSLNTPVRDLGILNDALALMGQQLFEPPSVAGWAGGRSWINTSTLFVRQNILTFLLTGKTPSGYDPLARVERYDPTGLLADLAQVQAGSDRDATQVASYLARFTLGPNPAPERLRVLNGFVESTGSRVTSDTVTGMLALITAMPEYQLC
jgi:uncharacterized protein (DUF1800 family)